jgi:hypothetical protein
MHVAHAHHTLTVDGAERPRAVAVRHDDLFAVSRAKDLAKMVVTRRVEDWEPEVVDAKLSYGGHASWPLKVGHFFALRR